MAQCRMKRFDVTGNSALILQRALKYIADNVPLAPQETANAERRQLTVLFADMADSTALSQRIDPEELRGINRTYQDAAKTAIEAYGGYIARYMGDGVLAYFGYPVVHEDDADRAIRAGLDWARAVPALATTQTLAVRIGIAPARWS